VARLDDALTPWTKVCVLSKLMRFITNSKSEAQMATTKKLAAEKQGSHLQKQLDETLNPGNQDSQNLNALSLLRMFRPDFARKLFVDGAWSSDECEKTKAIFLMPCLSASFQCGTEET
jgi:hypothetical protein